MCEHMIQLELTAKFWGYSTSPSRVRISRFRFTEKTKESLFALRDKYAVVWDYQSMKQTSTSYVEILSFLEKT